MMTETYRNGMGVEWVRRCQGSFVSLEIIFILFLAFNILPVLYGCFYTQHAYSIWTGETSLLCSYSSSSLSSIKMGTKLIMPLDTLSSIVHCPICTKVRSPDA